MQAGDAARVVELCMPLDEESRARLTEQAVALAQRQKFRSGGARAADVAALCVGPPLIDVNPWTLDHETVAAAVRSRPRGWRDEWAAWWVRRNPDAAWSPVRALIRAGDCDEPPDDDYAQAMVYGIAALAYERGGYEKVADVLRDERELLERDVWRIFQAPSLWAAGYYGHGNDPRWTAWSQALVELAADGLLPRDRLVAETVGALRREADPSALRGLALFHDRFLAPTQRELAAHADDYLGLLDSGHDARIGFALKHLTALDREAPVDGRALIERLPPVMALRSKAHVRRALALLDRVLRREPALVPDGLELALDALGHDAVEVQAAAAGVLERHAAALDADRRQRLATLAAALDPAVRARVERFAAVERPAATVAAVAVPPPAVIDPDAVPRALPTTALAPVEDVDELLELASVVLERGDDPDEVERFIDGVSRLCDRPVAAGRANALLKRVGRRRTTVGSQRHKIAFHWLKPGADVMALGWVGPTASLDGRLRALCQRLNARRPAVMLSAPTHLGGFVDPLALARRLEQAELVEDHDLAQALVRLPAHGRAAGLARIAGADGETAAIARAALGDGRPPPAERITLPASWDAAGVLVDPGSVAFDPPPQGMRVSYKPGEPLSPARLLARSETLWDVAAGNGLGVQRLLALVWPGRREVYYEGVVRALWYRLLGRVQREQRITAALTTMLYPDETLGRRARQVLAQALQAPDANRLLATDVVVDAIATRRLVPEAMGRALARSLEWSGAPPDRLAASLSPVAGHSALHAHELQRILESMLASLGDAQPRMPAVLDLLRRLAQDADARVTDEGARAALERFGGRSPSARAARAALRVTGDGAARSVEAAAAANAADRERALRWSSSGVAA